MKHCLVILVLFFLVTTNAQSTIENKDYSMTDRFPLEKYSKMKKVQKQLEKVNIYDITYHSFDKTKVKGFLLLPNEEGKKYPVIIFNRGGNGSFGMVNDQYIIAFLSKIASRGFIIIGSQLRGSEGSEGLDEFGGKDIDDVMSLFGIINNIQTADTTKIAQIGWSRGGITNFQLLKRTKKIRTTINIAGPSDILKTNRKEMFVVYQNRVRNYALDSIYYSNKISPIFQIDSILNKKESFLFMHGDQDERVSVSDSKELYKKTKRKGYKSKLIIFKNSEHSLFNQFEKAINDIVVWLNEQLI
ncbi:prolyl oligopeptidase family serine peptidase [Flavobacterium sp. AC]|uniref:Prolyl oligopeptidase family serine peptidase n=1 Tax=Flavobacterium azizsancarii TaxID=2961580 RepID=A0ABT4WE85_9FLAO|nr:prolyl oligopeptidase family serine peptidase [Flavobacterium azizsancarii]MDA6070898.1 prolyl oligopeptidase family serine peptidase [Flavobacterium azizsancarii]